MSKPIEIQKNTNKWEIINWFSYFKYDNGIITCRFDKRLKPYYLTLKKLFLISDFRNDFANPFQLLLKGFILLLKGVLRFDTIGVHREVFHVILGNFGPESFFTKVFPQGGFKAYFMRAVSKEKRFSFKGARGSFHY